MKHWENKNHSKILKGYQFNITILLLRDGDIGSLQAYSSVSKKYDLITVRPQFNFASGMAGVEIK